MSNCYYTGAGNTGLCYELYDKARLEADRNLISSAADEMVHSMGQKVEYWINSMELSGADLIYGEQPTSVYHGPKNLKMLITLNETSLSISKFGGFDAGDDVTAYITYNNFVSAMSGDDIFTRLNQDIEPKSGDVFKMTEYGNDRVNGRGGNMFQITQRRDQSVGESMNPLGGHYGWEIKAKRLEYSWEPGLPQESANTQINDDTFYGKLTSTIAGEVSSADLSYGTSVDEESKHYVIDMNFNDTSVYGTYDLQNTDQVTPNKAKHILDIATNEEEIIKIAEERIKELEEAIIRERFIRTDVDGLDGGDF